MLYLVCCLISSTSSVFCMFALYALYALRVYTCSICCMLDSFVCAVCSIYFAFKYSNWSIWLVCSVCPASIQCFWSLLLSNLSTLSALSTFCFDSFALNHILVNLFALHLLLCPGLSSPSPLYALSALYIANLGIHIMERYRQSAFHKYFNWCLTFLLFMKSAWFSHYSIAAGLIPNGKERERVSVVDEDMNDSRGKWGGVWARARGRAVEQVCEREIKMCSNWINNVAEASNEICAA